MILKLVATDNKIIERVIMWDAVANNTTIELTASFEAGSAIPAGPYTGQTATTVEVRMDAQVATKLYQKLHGLAQTMGWPLPQ